MSQSVNTMLETLDHSISELEARVASISGRNAKDQGALFGISEEEKKLNKNIASKLDSTIERLETLLAED